MSATDGLLWLRFPDVTDQVLQGRAAEHFQSSVVLLYAPGPEVEVEFARCCLDRGPQGPSVVRHQSEERGSGHGASGCHPEVGLDQFRELLLIQLRLTAKIAQL